MSFQLSECPDSDSLGCVSPSQFSSSLFRPEIHEFGRPNPFVEALSAAQGAINGCRSFVPVMRLLHIRKGGGPESLVPVGWSVQRHSLIRFKLRQPDGTNETTRWGPAGQGLSPRQVSSVVLTSVIITSSAGPRRSVLFWTLWLRRRVSSADLWNHECRMKVCWTGNARGLTYEPRAPLAP